VREDRTDISRQTQCQVSLAAVPIQRIP